MLSTQMKATKQERKVVSREETYGLQENQDSVDRSHSKMLLFLNFYTSLNSCN